MAGAVTNRPYRAWGKYRIIEILDRSGYKYLHILIQTINYYEHPSDNYNRFECRKRGLLDWRNLQLKDNLICGMLLFRWDLKTLQG